MFKTKEEKQREAELEAQRLEKEKIEKAEKEIAEQRAREKEFQNKLKEELKNDIVCFRTYDTKQKEAYLNFFISNGYICVENNFSCTQSYYYYSLTFAKEHLKDRFSSK